MKLVLVGVLLLLVICVFVFAPLVLIWSLNALVPTLAIGYSLKTWFAAFLIMAMLGGTSAASRHNKS